MKSRPALRILVVCCLAFAGIIPGVQAGQATDDSRPAALAVSEPALRQNLLDLLEEDQQARRALLELLPESGQKSGNVKLENPSLENLAVIMRVKSVEARTTRYMKQLLETHGFPRFDQVGRDGAHAA